jgi:signal transduction histidine kinase
VLDQFLTDNRAELIARCRSSVAQRPVPAPHVAELEHGIPLFLEQLIRTLRAERSPDPAQRRQVSSELAATAARHGLELLEHGFTVDQVVHDYGDLCQAVTELAFERAAPVSVDEFRTLNRCLDDAIAGAVTEFSGRRDTLAEERSARTLSERLGSLAHELRNLAHTATLAVSALKAGRMGLGGATGAVLERSLMGLHALIDRSLSEVRASAGAPARLRRLSVAALIAEVRTSAAFEAQSRGCAFSVAGVERHLAVAGDRELLLCALGNLLQNAFKFTAPRTEVSLSARADAGRVVIEVADHCGGLPPGKAQRLFAPFVQAGADRSGVGLGLAIAQRSVEASGGRLSVRDVPGKGCIFTIDLPRHSLAEAPVR